MKKAIMYNIVANVNVFYLYLQINVQLFTIYFIEQITFFLQNNINN